MISDLLQAMKIILRDKSDMHEPQIDQKLVLIVNFTTSFNQ